MYTIFAGLVLFIAALDLVIKANSKKSSKKIPYDSQVFLAVNSEPKI